MYVEAANWITGELSSSTNQEKNVATEVENKIDALQPIAEKYDRSFRTSKLIMDEETVIRLENAASSLWNSIAIAIKIEKDDRAGQLLCRCKFFASILLSIHEALGPSNERKLRTFKCYVNIFKVATDRNWAQLTKKIQEQLDKVLRILEGSSSSFTRSESKNFQKLKFEFFLLHFQISLGEGDFETAKIYSSKTDIIGNMDIIDGALLLELCRIIYNAAVRLRGQLPKPQIDATREILSLLKDVQSYLELPVAELKTHVDYSNLKYSTILFLTNCLIEQPLTDWDPIGCEKYLNLLQNEYPKKIEPFTLSMTFSQKKNGPNTIENIEEILMRMIMSVDVISNFDAVVGAINEFSAMSTKRATVCLDYMLMNKLDPEKDHKWLEKLLVSRFFITTQAKTMTDSEIVASLEGLCDQIERRLMRSISKHSMSSIVTLLWNSGKKLEKSGKYEESVGFYKLSLSGVISQNYSDKGKIQRALQSAYINIQDNAKAENIYQNMDPIDKESPLTQLLMLKIYLYKDDQDSALKCLEMMRFSEHENAIDALILAASECKKSTDLAIKAMSFLFEAMEDQQISKNKMSNWSIPTFCLLRYTLQMLMKMAEDEEENVFTNYLPTMRRLLEKGIEYLRRIKVFNELGSGIEKDPKYEEVISVDEIEWFAATSYNIALKCLDDHVKLEFLDFSKFSLQYLQLIPIQEFTFPKMLHYTYWRFRSTIMCLLIGKNVLLPGNEAGLRDIQCQSSDLMDEISRKKNSQEFNDGCGPNDIEQLDECFIDALNLNYEIALILRDTIKVSDILKMTSRYQDPKIETLLVNSAKSVPDLPRGVLIEVLHTIIERNIRNTSIEDYAICSWLRSLLDSSLNVKHDSRKDLTERVLARLKTTFSPNDQKSDLLKQEAEMIATLSWNEGIKSIINDERAAGISWCSSSIQFSSLVNQALEVQLRNLWKSLASSAEIPEDAIKI